MAVNINFDDCIGCGVCMQVCPAVFGLDEESGKALLLSDESAGEKSELLKDALDSCPIGCINM